MDSNFLDKVKAGITKSPRLSSDQIALNKLKTNTIEAEFHKIAYGPSQQKRLKTETIQHKSVGDFWKNPSQGKDFSSRGKSIWQQWGISLVNFLTGKQTLSVREKRLKSGERQWRVYDSHSDTRHVFESEAGVRSWLEQRYYR